MTTVGPISLNSSGPLETAYFPASAPRLFALIPCAGNGSRAGRPGSKQYQPLAGKPMVRHAVDAFRALGGTLSGVWVVVSPDDSDFERVFPDFNGAHEVLLKAGGATRAATVLNGLQALLRDVPDGARPGDWVLVHDAARCLVTPAQISALIDACLHDEVGGLLAQPLPDTLKSGEAGRVASTIDRAGKWLAQTPQMFRIGVLVDALQAAGAAVTDESGAMEAAGFAPRLVTGSAQNFKITYPEDFALAEAILASRNGGAGETDFPATESRP
jgi:2-C-methyl-D-erythritol 4-phosphate cytidylyltransferase